MSYSPTQSNNAHHRENYTSNQKTFIDTLSTQTQTLSEIVNSYETKIYKDLTLSENIINKIDDHIDEMELIQDKLINLQNLMELKLQKESEKMDEIQESLNLEYNNVINGATKLKTLYYNIKLNSIGFLNYLNKSNNLQTRHNSSTNNRQKKIINLCLIFGLIWPIILILLTHLNSN